MNGDLNAKRKSWVYSQPSGFFVLRRIWILLWNREYQEFVWSTIGGPGVGRGKWYEGVVTGSLEQGAVY